MLKIQRTVNGEVVFTLSGRLDGENIGELHALFGTEAEGHRIVLDLKDLTLVDRDAVRFLEDCEADSIKGSRIVQRISARDCERKKSRVTRIVTT